MTDFVKARDLLVKVREVDPALACGLFDAIGDGNLGAVKMLTAEAEALLTARDEAFVKGLTDRIAEVPGPWE